MHRWSVDDINTMKKVLALTIGLTGRQPKISRFLAQFGVPRYDRDCLVVAVAL
jgi:hypothetical protein